MNKSNMPASMDYYHGIGLYTGLRVMDDYGNLIVLDNDQMDICLYHHTGYAHWVQ